MVRRRREDASDPSDPALPPELQTGEPQIDVRMRGTADAVKKQLGVATDTEKKPEKKPDGNGHDEEKKKFVDVLRNSKYIIRVKRLTPREVNGFQTNVEVWQTELPLSYQEIMDEVAKSYLGGKYRVAVIDPSSNSTVAADTFEVPGDPLLPEGMSQEEQDRILMRGPEKSPADLTEEGLDRRARTTAKMLEVEALEGQLEEARIRRTKPSEKPFVQDNTRVDDLERRLTEAKHQAEIESRDRKHAEEMRELKALIAQNSKPRQEGPSEMTLLLQQMQKNQESSDKRFEAMQKQMQDDKLNAVLEEIKAVRNRPAKENGTMLEMADAMLKMKKLFGWGGDDDDDDDDAPDPNDDRPWWERALDKFGDKVIPKLIEKFDGMEEKGAKVTREDFMKELQAVAKAEEDAAVARAQARIAGQANPGLPAPVVTAPAAIPPPPNPPVPDAFKPPQKPTVPVSELPPPPPPPAAPAASAAPAGMTLEQEVALRVSGVLEILSREVELRPNEYLWNYEGVWQSLPEELREKIAAAPDPAAMIDVFRIPAINPELLNELKKKVSENPRIVAWLKVGLDELRDWTAEKQKDASFDPMDEEEEAA